MSGKPGRPPLGEDVILMNVRVPRATREEWAAAAAAGGLSLSEWMRSVLDRAARRVRR